MKLEVSCIMTGYLEVRCGTSVKEIKPGTMIAIRCNARSAERDSLVHLLQTVAAALASAKIDDDPIQIFQSLQLETVHS